MQLYSHCVTAVFLSCCLLLFGIATALPFNYENSKPVAPQMQQTFSEREQEGFDGRMVQEDDQVHYNEYSLDLQSLYNEAVAASCPIDKKIIIPTVKPPASTERYPTCAAFVIDLTESMTGELSSIKSVLADFLNSQLSVDSEYCYILVPFIGPGMGLRPIAVADSRMPGSLQTLINRVNQLRIGGGTTQYEEEALQGIMRALNHKGKDVPGFVGDQSYDLMKNGQVILLTDSASQRQNLKSTIISKANELNACVNSFISPFSFSDPYGRPLFHNPVADGTYEEISSKTSGVFVDPGHFSYFQLGKFVAENAHRPCNNEKSEEPITGTKQADGKYCGTVKVSVLTNLLKLAIEAKAVVTIMDPNGTEYTTNPSGGLATFSKDNPESGDWKVCSERALNIAVGNEVYLRTAVGYSMCTDGKSRPTITQPPPACAKGRIVVASSYNSNKIKTASMLLKDSDGKVLQTMPLTVCGGTFVTDELSFPQGTFTYEIEGTDTNGVPFKYDRKETVVFESKANLYELSADTSLINMDVGEKFKVVYTLKNKGKYCTSFNVKVPKVEGFEIEVLPSGITENELALHGKGSVEITVIGHATSAAAGKTHQIPITVSNDCSTVKKEKPVKVAEGKPTTPGPSPSVAPPLSTAPPENPSPSSSVTPPGPTPSIAPPVNPGPCSIVCATGYSCQWVHSCNDIIQQCAPDTGPTPPPTLPPEPENCLMKCKPGYHCAVVNSGQGKIQQCVPDTGPTPPPEPENCLMKCKPGYHCAVVNSGQGKRQQCVPDTGSTPPPPEIPESACPVLCPSGQRCALVDGKIQQCIPDTGPLPPPEPENCLMKCKPGFHCAVVNSGQGKLQQCVPDTGSTPPPPEIPESACPVLCPSGQRCVLVDGIIQQCVPYTGPTPPPEPEIPESPCPVLCPSGQRCVLVDGIIQQCVPETGPTPPPEPENCLMKCKPGYHCAVVNSGQGKIQQCVPDTEPTPPPEPENCLMKCKPGFHCAVVNSGHGKIQQCVPDTGPTPPPEPENCLMKCKPGYHCEVVDSGQQCVPDTGPTPPTPPPEIPESPCPVLCPSGQRCVLVNAELYGQACAAIPGLPPSCNI